MALHAMDILIACGVFLLNYMRVFLCCVVFSEYYIFF